MKRVVAGMLWTLVIMWAGTYVTMLLGLPAIVVLFFAVAIGGLITLDPAGQIWPKATERPTVASVRPPTAELTRTA